ncbi:MAG: ribonuclease J [Deltaproteobacteria bacterium]|nr:ribonuclease J [Deltaproteobacteria bacterium]
MQPADTADRVRLVPLGGFGQIGANCLTIEIDKRILVVDCGVIFPSEPKSGVEIKHPPFDYLVDKKEDIAAIVITHGHEDHVGALPFLLSELDIAVFTDRYTSKIIASRLEEYNIDKKHLINIIEPEQSIDAGGFKITPFYIPHSINGNFAFFATRNGVGFFHSSDFKLNVTQNKSSAKLIKKIENFSRENAPVNLMITDSTGALEDEPAGSEAEVKDAIDTIVKNYRGRVFVVLFSSNVERINNLGSIARKYGFKLVLSGKSVVTNYYRAVEHKICDSYDDILISENDAGKYPLDKMLLLLSGTQGEKRSSLGRLAFNNHSKMSVQPGDTVVFSSRFIPGNEINISKAINALLEQGAEVLHTKNSESNIHVSGHGSINEIETLIKLIRPENVLPAHGTFEFMSRVDKLCSSLDINSLVLKNGECAFLTDGKLEKSDCVINSGKVSRCSGGFIIDESVLSERKKIGTTGVVSINVFLPADLENLVKIAVDSLGLFSLDLKAQKHIEIVSLVNSVLEKNTMNEILKLKKVIFTEVRRYVKSQTGFKASVIISIEN